MHRSTEIYSEGPCAQTPKQTPPQLECVPLGEQLIAFDERPESLMIQYPDQRIQIQGPCTTDLGQIRVCHYPILQKKLN